MNVSIECEDCNTVLFDIDAAEEAEDDDTVPGEPAPDLSDSDEEDLNYEDPEE